ncbi:LysR substrate-binding domain-containing protein [Rhizobium sp. L1K21]|uniref:LysR substrate-binding domain-containing protein n=1 Tax=Rhizobium sp. L1K21 TaxID=2954933 RepID=UPI0020935395|nr:LysR substrate-binding domain-containing protein [Rhizobium sp. L1K21]MCO6186743.1 LysR substrate-binding domain-containing protein [Rhizobium sp. L1K21]
MSELNRIHLNGLRAVETVYRLGSLQAAADALGVSPGAVSQQIIRTESQLGQPLFERTPKGLKPLDTVVPALQRMTDAFDMLASATAMARHRDDDILTVSIAPIFAARWLVHRLPDFLEKNPGIRLRFDAVDGLVSFTGSDIDAAIRYGPGGWPGVDADLLFEQDIFPVCAPALAKTLKTPADLARVPVLVDDNWHFGWETWMEPAGIADLPLRRGPSFSNASLCLDAAISGQGVALTWDILAQYALDNGQVVEPFHVRVKSGWATYFVTPQGKRLPKSVNLFRDWLKAELKLAGKG